MLVDKLKSSLSLSFLDKYVGYTLRFVSTVIIARLCTPNEIGIFSVAFVLISIGHVLRDFGVAQYLIQKPELNKRQIRASLTVMWLIAWGLFALLWLSKSWISQFYGEPQLEQSIEILSLIFLLAPFGSVRIALLRREMDFGKLAKINIGSYLGLHFTTIYMAWQGFGLYALVWGQVAGVVMTLLGTLYYSPPNCWHWPGFKGMRDVFRFGVPLCVSNILETASDNGADLVLGRALSMQAVGFFGKAQGLMNLFKIAVSSAVWPVVLPYFSIKNRENSDLLPDYLKAMELYTLFAWPFFIGLWFFTDAFVLVLFGDQWLTIIPLVKVLCFAAMIQALFPFYNAILVAKGAVGRNLYCQIVFSILRLSAICIGVLYGLKAVAIALLIAEVFCSAYLYYTLKKVLALSVVDILKAIRIPVTSCFVLIVFFSMLRPILASIDLVLIGKLAVPLVGGLLVWTLHLKLSNHTIYHIMLKPFAKLKGNHHVSG